MRFAIVIVSIIFFNTWGFAQDSSLNVEAILTRTVKTYDAPSYSFNIAYKMFSDATSTKVEEYYTGKIIKYQGQNYSKIHNTEFIQLAESFLQVNHDEKAILYSAVSMDSNITSVIDLKGLLKSFSKSTVTENKDTYICKFTATKISVLPYSKAVLYIDKANYTIKKQVLYLADQVSYDTAEGDKKTTNPRLEITFLNFKTSGINTMGVFNINKYISINKNVVSPSNSLKGYEVVK